MTSFWFKTSICAILISIELFAGNCGIALPLSAIAVIYFSWTTNSEIKTFLLALITGLVVDAVCGRSFPFSTLLLLLSILSGRKLLPEGIAKKAALSAVISGGGFALIEAIYLIVLEVAGFDIFSTIGSFILSTLLSLIFWALVFPFFAMILDFIAEKIGLPTYFEHVENDSPLPRRRLRRINRRTLKRRAGSEK